MIQKLSIILIALLGLCQIVYLRPQEAFKAHCEYQKQNETGNKEAINIYYGCMRDNLVDVTNITMDNLFEQFVPVIACASDKYTNCTTQLQPMPPNPANPNLAEDPVIFAEAGGLVACPVGKPWSFVYTIKDCN